MKITRLAGCFGLFLLFFAADLNLQAQTWTFTGSMGAQRAFFTATVLNNGQVLAAGGRNRAQGYGLASAVLYNPSTGTFSVTGNLNTGRANFTATLLQNGQVLVAGGDAYIFSSTGTTHQCYASAELYDSRTGKFTSTGSMSAARCGSFAPGFTATLLQNGKVLIAGGSNPNGLVATAELFDPSTGTFSPTGSLNTARINHTATLLPNGEVLIAGGVATNYLASAELYNPSTGTFTRTGSMHTARDLFTATLLVNGQVLAAGGENSNLVAPFLTSAELFDPSTGKWSTTGSLNNGRYNHTATLLNSGDVLIVGGGAHLASTELYDPTQGKFKLAANLNTGRTDHSTVLLANGVPLTMGGYDGSGGNIGYLSSAELFH